MQTPNYPETLHKLTHGLLLDGGATVSLNGEVTTRGYAVSHRPDLEYTFPYFRCNTHLMLNIKQWLESLPPLPDDNHTGIWLDMETSTIYLDISIVFDYQATAESLGRWYHQKAVFDIQKQETIWLTKQSQ